MSVNRQSPVSFSPAPLAVLLGTGTFIAAIISYFLSAAYGHVPWCVVFWESCSSISAAGAQTPGVFRLQGDATATGRPDVRVLAASGDLAPTG